MSSECVCLCRKFVPEAFLCAPSVSRRMAARIALSARPSQSLRVLCMRCEEVLRGRIAVTDPDSAHALQPYRRVDSYSLLEISSSVGASGRAAAWEPIEGAVFRTSSIRAVAAERNVEKSLRRRTANSTKSSFKHSCMLFPKRFPSTKSMRPSRVRFRSAARCGKSAG